MRFVTTIGGNYIATQHIVRLRSNGNTAHAFDAAGEVLGEISIDEMHAIMYSEDTVVPNYTTARLRVFFEPRNEGEPIESESHPIIAWRIDEVLGPEPISPFEIKGIGGIAWAIEYLDDQGKPYYWLNRFHGSYYTLESVQRHFKEQFSSAVHSRNQPTGGTT